MTEQVSALEGAQNDEYAPKNTRLWNKFMRFHQANPHVYQIFKNTMIEAKEKGFNNIGIGFLAEVIRWNTNIKTFGDLYKIGNTYRAYYARLLMHDNPDYKGFFRTRRVKRI